MSTRSSFLPRLSLSRGDSPVLPLHNSNRYPLNQKTSDYDLDELSPRPSDAFLSPDLPPTTYQYHHKSSDSYRMPSPSSSTRSNSKTRMKPDGKFLFAGPPPPIAQSRILYNDEEDHDTYDTYDTYAATSSSWLPTATGTARKAISSVIWDRRDGEASGSSSRDSLDRNSVWRSLQRREKAIVQDIQKFLEVQEANLSGLPEPGAGLRVGTTFDDVGSDAGSVTPTGTSLASSSRRLVRSINPVTRATPDGEVIPVRQPRPKKLGIGGARKAIAKSMDQLASLKDEEDASLLNALSTRKKALAKLRSLASRRQGIADELNALETDEEEPLTRELDEFEEERRGVSAEIEELEERLSGLKTRKRFLDTKIHDVKNRREAGLSGYKNALKEVEDNVKGFLGRPPVKPLDVEALRPAAGDDVEDHEDTEATRSPGGIEFLRLRPERRTIDMAREWWEGEVQILEKRKAQVDTERRALEEGAGVWEEVIGLVLDFEADLRKQMQGSTDISGKGKGRTPTTEETLKLQDDKIKSVIRELEHHLDSAERKGWNLLIVAISAELEAFREADRMNAEMMRANGIEVDDSSRQAVREDSGVSHNSFHTVPSGSGYGDTLLEMHNDKALESDNNEVPADLLPSNETDTRPDDYWERNGGDHRPGVDPPSSEKDDSENEVPLEFLAEHRREDVTE